MSKRNRDRATRGNPGTPTPTLDTDALQQQIADYEALLASPGWQGLMQHAQAQFGTRVVNDRVTAFVLRAERDPSYAPTVHASVAYVTAQREAALLLLGLPGELIKAAQQQLAAWAERQARGEATLGDGVEMTRGTTQG